jgi:hypothetical protein
MPPSTHPQRHVPSRRFAQEKAVHHQEVQVPEAEISGTGKSSPILGPQLKMAKLTSVCSHNASTDSVDNISAPSSAIRTTYVLTRAWRRDWHKSDYLNCLSQPYSALRDSLAEKPTSALIRPHSSKVLSAETQSVQLLIIQESKNLACRHSLPGLSSVGDKMSTESEEKKLASKTALAEWEAMETKSSRSRFCHLFGVDLIPRRNGRKVVSWEVEVVMMFSATQVKQLKIILGSARIRLAPLYGLDLSRKSKKWSITRSMGWPQ